MQFLRDDIDRVNRESQEKLNQLLLNEFSVKLGIKYEEAQLAGRPKKRLLNAADIEALKPFHWGYHFDRVLDRGGFDAIITNPPWEVFKPQAKEFFLQFSDLINKKKMDLQDFEREQEEILKDTEIASAWLKYQSYYPYSSSYYRLSIDYANQTPIINGRRIGTDINFYKLFLERCFRLMRSGGECGIVVPSGIYTDLGTQRLRRMLFEQSQVTGLFCFENRRGIFEDVHRSYKFIILTFEKGGRTESFPAAFMRREVNDLEKFPTYNSVDISVEAIQRIAPNSLSILEFKSQQDIDITEKMSQHPPLASTHTGWQFEIYGEELHMNRSRRFFRNIETRCPLYEGGMIWQFNHQYSTPTYWIEESELRKAFLAKRAKRIKFSDEVPDNIRNDYEVYRLAIRKIASNTNERTLIASLIPPFSFAGNSLSVNFPFFHDEENYNTLRLSDAELIVLASLLNSFVVDYSLRLRMTTNLNSFYLYQLPVPRLIEGDPYFSEIVERAAKLICTTPEFDELAAEVELGSHADGVTDEVDRAKLRAELDGMIAHLYGLTEDEFQHILSTFPIVPIKTKEAAIEAYRAFAPLVGDREILDLIAAKDENHQLEFKSTARWDLVENKKNVAMEEAVMKTVAAFLNSVGGTLLIGVADDGSIVGLQPDYQAIKPKNRDAYERWLTTFLLTAVGKDLAPYIHVRFAIVDTKEVCQVTVDRSPRPVYVNFQNKETFFIRTGNQTIKLENPSEIMRYTSTQWSNP
ncbi:putative DNA binding domain-containing protein [Microcoleus sp. FACHB-1515]|uniref:RNA-binding domain-containing protein n=1 Tax=Cyanophyceae TaxID=3028117 RepID=UPI0016886380|nr:RNA-binding domain-containing protein [Microcoleus sp. FACHB-1515]MBD2090203.1 putative DNA binding domain-containing protein [Microcoleus sp. FACHB-1515]